MPSQTSGIVEQPEILVQEPPTLQVEPLSPPDNKVLVVGHKLAERLSRLADDLERGIEEREQQTHLMARIVSFSGVALSAAFLAWLLRGGSLVARSLVSMPAWRRLDPLPVPGEDGRDRQTHDRDPGNEHGEESRQFPDLDRVLQSSTKPVKPQETGHMGRSKT